MKAVTQKKILIISHLISGLIVFIFYALPFAARDHQELLRAVIVTPILLLLVALTVSKITTNPIKFTLISTIASAICWVLALGYIIDGSMLSRPIFTGLIASIKFSLFAVILSAPVVVIGGLFQYGIIKTLKRFCH